VLPLVRLPLATTHRSTGIMRFSIAVAAILGGLQAASALKLSPRNAVEREEQVCTSSFIHGMHVMVVAISALELFAFLMVGR
jgi:hypothetical protein